MEPLERGFRAPTFDFFRPRRTRGSYDFIGTEVGKKGLYLVSLETPYLENQRRKRHRVLIPSDSIQRTYINDLGGWSIDFAYYVVYMGNGGGGAQFKFPGEEARAIIYDSVARVRKNDGTVIWENEAPWKDAVLSTDITEIKHQQVRHTDEQRKQYLQRELNGVLDIPREQLSG